MILTDEPQNRDVSAGVFLPKTPFQTAADDRTNNQKKRLTGRARRSKE
ncbi:hypothetical protein SynA1562_02040 [Synechococcus sp. A15-62]|nr:hypothetical protein SynA1562_02040 [Synechococcus sp. A15-62]